MIEQNILMNKVMKFLKGSFFFYFIVIASLSVRLINIDAPLATDLQSFRQTQTAITVQSFIHSGFDPLHYQTPVLGPDWQIPFEFPVFQSIIYLVWQVVPFLSLDLIARIVSVAMFFLSAFVLFLFVKRFTRRVNLSKLITLVYIFNPYSLFWSRAVLIDYLSVLLFMSYILLLDKTIREKFNPFIVIACFLVGTLAFLTKITSAIPCLAFASGFVLYSIFSNGLSIKDAIVSFFKKYFTLRNVIYFLVIFVIPLVIEIMWIRYTDFVKEQNPFTTWLTSDALKNWNYGTLQEKISPIYWLKIFFRISQQYFPFVIIPLVFAGLFFSFKDGKNNRAIFIISLMAILSTIFVFINLYYEHDYYFIAITPFLSVLIGYGLYYLFRIFMPKHSYLLVISGLLVLASFVIPRDYYQFLLPGYRESHSVNTLGAYIKNSTKENERVLITQDWSSAYLYAADRKGLMLRDSFLVDIPNLPVLIEKMDISLAVLKPEKKYQDLLKIWKYNQKINQLDGMEIYRVSNAVPFATVNK